MSGKVDRDERREELAEAVWRVICRSGIQGVTIRSVAAEAGWTRGVVQLYFRDKEDLLLFAFELAARHALEVDARAMGAATGLERVRRLLLAYVRPDEEQRTVVNALLALYAMCAGLPTLQRAGRDNLGAWTEASREFFATVASEGGFRDGLDFGVAAIEYLALAIGLAEIDFIDHEALAGAAGGRVVDEYLGRVGAPDELKRLGIAP